MDDANQNAQLADTQPQVQGQQSVATPVGTPQKEQQPVPSEVSEFVRPSEVEPTIHPELAEIGVEKVKEVQDLTLEDKKAGLSAAKESVPVSTAPTGLVQLPMTEEEAKRTIKTTSPSESRHWLAALVKKISKLFLKYGSNK